MTLLAVPNVSEGRDPSAIESIGRAFEGEGDARLLDVHSDPDHNRSVFTLAGEPGRLAQALLSGAREAVERIDLTRHEGVHPHVGVLDVAPVVFLHDAQRGAACAEALVAADLLGTELEIPVFLYGPLGGGRTRQEIRRGGAQELRQRLESGDLKPDFGPSHVHPTAGATLVAARPPLVAFNLVLAPPADLQLAKEIAGRIREGAADGLPGVRALGLALERSSAVQVTTNIEDHQATPVAEVVETVRKHAPIAEAELVGLAPRAAFDGLPDDVPVRNLRFLEDALASG